MEFFRFDVFGVQSGAFPGKAIEIPIVFKIDVTAEG